MLLPGRGKEGARRAEVTADPFLDDHHIADVVVAALTKDGHICHLYELTGPRLLTLTEVSAAIGREVTFVSMSKSRLRN